MSIRGFAFPRRVWVIKTVPICTLIDQNKTGYGYGTRINFISFTIERKKWIPLSIHPSGYIYQNRLTWFGVGNSTTKILPPQPAYLPDTEA